MKIIKYKSEDLYPALEIDLECCLYGNESEMEMKANVIWTIIKNKLNKYGFTIKECNDQIELTKDGIERIIIHNDWMFAWINIIDKSGEESSKNIDIIFGIIKNDITEQ